MGPRAIATLFAAGGMAWLVGLAMQLQQAALWPARAYVGLVLAGVAMLAGGGALARCALRRVATGVAGLLVVTAAAALALGLAGWRAAERLASVLPAAREGTDLVVTGTVATLPQRGSQGVRFRFDVETVDGARPAAGFPDQLALGWYTNVHEDAAGLAPQADLRAGERWRLTVRLRRPHGNVNPHGFDHELLLFEQGVRATGYVRESPPPLRLAEAAGYPMQRLRQKVRDAIDTHVADRRAAGVLAALSIGDQGAIDREDWELFRTTGIAHLVSISGLHVTMFAWLAAAAIGAGWRRFPRAMLTCPAPTVARWGGVAAATAYAAFSGWGVPSQRTVWMLATVALLCSLGVRWPWWAILLAAAVVVTAIDPWAMTQAGFWLSFAAVGLLMASSPVTSAAAIEPPMPRDATWPRRALAAWRRVAAHAGAGVRTQVVATIGLAPLTLVVFQQVSLVGFVANLVAIPVVTLLVTPLALLGVLAPPLWWLGQQVVQALVRFLGWLAAAPEAVWFASAAPLWARVMGLVGALLVVAPLPWRARALALVLMLPLVAPPRTLPEEGRYEVVAVDVGQGTAVIVRTRHHVLLFDAGPLYSRESDAGQRVLVPLLRARGDAAIDMLVLSHRDSDHVGGAAAVLRTLPVRRVLASLERDHPLLQQAGARAAPCVAGERWVWDGVAFEVLHPPAPAFDPVAKANTVSCVLRVSAPGRRVLLTGDVERGQEQALVDRYGRAGLASDVLVVPHHGSRTSSSAAFLEAVAPAMAIAQAGYRNRFGHPAPDVVARYAERGIGLRTSPACGAWIWPSDEPLAGAVCWRDVSRRYWRRE